jgi:hypothetical protein
LWIFYVIFVVLDFVGLLERILPNIEITIAHTLILFVIAFLVANVILYIRMDLRLEELEAYEAEVIIYPKNHKFSHTRFGFYNNGVPKLAGITVNVELENVGFDRGELEMTFKSEKSNGDVLIML